MNFLVLVVGVTREESGKTIIAEGLAAGLKEAGVRVSIFKPLALVDWYRDWRVLREEGIVAKEAIEARNLLGIREDARILNPVAYLTIPLNIKTFYDYGVPRSFFAYQADPNRRIAAARLTVYREGELHTHLLLNSSLFRRGLSIVSKEEVIERVAGRARVEEVEDHRALAARSSALAYTSIAECLHHLKRRYRVILVEGLGDFAWPLGSLTVDVHVVLAVAPGIVLSFDPRKYKLAVKFRAEMGEPVRLEDIAGYLTPLEYFKIRPAEATELPDTIAEKIPHLLDYIINLLEQ